MNLLAHLHLIHAAPPGTVAGNLLADYRRRYPPMPGDADFLNGVLAHQTIDRFTDAHPLHHEARTLISTPRRRLAGIIIDVACDFVLANHWPLYHPQPLHGFIDHQLARIEPYLRQSGSPLHEVMLRMRSGAWLKSYSTFDGLRLTFRRVASRTPAAQGLVGAESEIETHQNTLTHLFTQFYPALQAHMAAWTPPTEPAKSHKNN